MRGSVFIISVITLALALAQDQLEDDLSSIFTTPDTDFFKMYEDISSSTTTELTYIAKCGEAEDAGKHRCVPYYNCDAKTKTIIPSEEYDGSGLIDIRFGNNQCDDYLDVCCGIPPGGEPEDRSPVDGGTVTPTPTPTTPEPPVCGKRNPNGVDFKITGNKDNEAEYGEFPWMLAILKTNYDPKKESLAICGGSLITLNVVLTGAHCVYNKKTTDIKIRAGEWDTQTESERYGYQERNVQEIITHEKFTSNNLFNDVALLILSNPFDRAPHIGTICLPQQGQVFNSKECFASGWGKDIFGKAGSYQVILKKVQLPIIEHSQCQTLLRATRLGKTFTLHDSFTCAGGESGKDTCTGDGGSPLVCPDPQNPSRYIQAGIVAWGIGCGQVNVPGVYADVSHFRNWINNHMLRLNIDTTSYII